METPAGSDDERSSRRGRSEEEGRERGRRKGRKEEVRRLSWRIRLATTRSCVTGNAINA